MRTYKNLYQKIYSKENLMKAYIKAKRGKKKNRSIIDFSKNLEYEIEKLQKELMVRLEGWFGYAKWADTYKLIKEIRDIVEKTNQLEKVIR